MEHVFGEHNCGLLLNTGPFQGRGLFPRDFAEKPQGRAWRGATAFPKEKLVPRSEWDERIAEMEAKKTRLSDVVLDSGLPCKDQKSTNYCWINATTHCAEVNLVRANQLGPDGKPVELSSASVGCKVKGFRNNGGYGWEGLEYAIEHGWVPMSMWPNAAISRSYDTTAAWEAAKAYLVLEWWDGESRNFDEQMSCGFHRIPTSDGHSWWSHQVTGYDPVIVSNSVRDEQRRFIERLALRTVMDKVERDRRLEVAGSKYGRRKRNSWGMSYGDKGFFILTESKANADDWCCPRVMLPA